MNAAERGQTSASPRSNDSTPHWFAVRCLFRLSGSSTERGYEERITVWQAADVDDAIAKAEREAHAYAAQIKDCPDEYLGFAQAYALDDSPDHDGAEVFSLIRDSSLDPSSYLDRHFDTGTERQRDLGGGALGS